MNPEQFGQFVEAEQADRAAARQAVQQQHEQHIVAQQDTSSRQQVEAQAKKGPCL